MDSSRVSRVTLALVLLMLGSQSIPAVVIYESGDPDRNTSAPAGEWSGSGWDLQGTWRNFLGTPVSSRWFLTAGHVGGLPGDVFVLRGISYMALEFRDDPDSDLRLWRICGMFPDFAPLYTAPDEVGRPLVVFGRGTRRGEEVYVEDPPHPPRLRGWRWGSPDGRLRWGVNAVEEAVDGNALFERTDIGDLLKATFDEGEGPDECHLTNGDSGGAAFIRTDGIWKLAAIHYAADGRYNTSTNGDGFLGSVFDESGLYREQTNGWALVPPTGPPRPGAFFSTRISSRVGWIRSVIDEALPPVDPPIVVAATNVAAGYSYVSGVVAESNTLSVPLPGRTTFYRLKGCTEARIMDAQIVGAKLVLHYERNP